MLSLVHTGASVDEALNNMLRISIPVYQSFLLMINVSEKQQEFAIPSVFERMLFVHIA